MTKKKTILLCCLLFINAASASAGPSFNEQANFFIKKNEHYGNIGLKAWIDTKPTICNGMTFYFIQPIKVNKNTLLATLQDNKIKKDILIRTFNTADCKQLNNKMWRCDVKPNDILTWNECLCQSYRHIEYFNKKATQKIKSYNKLNINQKIVVVDILFNYGENNKNIKKLSSAINNFAKKRNTKTSLKVIEAIYGFSKNGIFERGQAIRSDRRVSLFFK